MPPGDAKPSVTLTEFADEWMRSRIDLAVRTIELYRWLLDRHIVPTFGARPLDSISPSDVRAWHAESARKHPTTAAKAYRLLSSVMRTAVADELIRRNPCQVRGAAVERAPERPVASIAEVDALANAMPPNLYIAVMLAAWCQLRRGEVRGLRRQDVDLERETLQINITRTTAMSGQSIIKEPKTRAGRRTVAIPPNILDRLRKHLERYVGLPPDAFVVAGSNRSLSVAWDHARSEVGRPEFRFHDLRHSGLTWSAATGASIAELMRRAGHASQAAAMRYQHATDDRDRILAHALADLADRAGGGQELREQDRQAESEGSSDLGLGDSVPPARTSST